MKCALNSINTCTICLISVTVLDIYCCKQLREIKLCHFKDYINRGMAYAVQQALYCLKFLFN